MWRGRNLLVTATIATASTSACGGEPFALQPIEDVFRPDAGFVQLRDDAETPAHDGGTDADVTETSLSDAAHFDVADASPQAALEATTCANPPSVASWGCGAPDVDGGLASSPGQFCAGPTRAMAPLETPHECLCDYTCGCVLAHLPADACPTGTSPVGCGAHNVYSPGISIGCQ